jgi:Family of unknown function (DUF6152)
MRNKLSLLVLQLASFSTTAMAHHSPAAHFVLTERSVITGTVTEYRFENPHALVFLDVAGKDGSVERWMAEGGNTSALQHLGWTGGEISPGDEVTIVGNPSRDGSRTINWQTITVLGGRQLAGGNGSFIFPALQARWQRHTAAETKR